jgi:hypothetical protein
VLPKAPRTALLAVSSLLGVTLWSAEALRYPGAFTLNVVIGDWIVVPIIVWLLIVLLRDLRSRIDRGLLFEDDLALEEPVTAPVQQPEAEQRIAAPAREGAGER